MLKPGLIYKSPNPRALKTKIKPFCPSTTCIKKAWITKALTLDWFINCFVPQVKLYLTEKGLPFKVVLFTDHAREHTTGLKNVALP
jgi:hypothetical protein